MPHCGNWLKSMARVVPRPQPCNDCKIMLKLPSVPLHLWPVLPKTRSLPSPLTLSFSVAGESSGLKLTVCVFAFHFWHPLTAHFYVTVFIQDLLYIVPPLCVSFSTLMLSTLNVFYSPICFHRITFQRTSIWHSSQHGDHWMTFRVVKWYTRYCLHA